MEKAIKDNPSVKNRQVVHTALAEALRKTTQQFEQKVSELSLVRRVSEIAGCVLDLKRFSQKLMSIILEETHAENCSFMVMDPDRNQLVIKAAQGRNRDLKFYDDIEKSLTAFKVGQGVCGKAALEHKTILINDVDGNECFAWLPTGIPIGSLLATPLVDKDKLLGVVNISHRRPKAFNENNRRVMEVLGRYLSSLIGNAVDYARVRDLERFKAMSEGVHLAIMLVDIKSRKIVECNSFAGTWLGHAAEALVNQKRLDDFLNPQDMQELSQVLRQTSEKRVPGVCVVRLVDKFGEEKFGELNAVVVPFQEREVLHVTIQDITERKELEKRLLQNEKLRSLGELAGGVAHDFNNILATVLGRVQLLGRSVDPPPGSIEKRQSMLALREGLAIIEKAALDGAETVRRIREFSRRGDERDFFSPVCINHIIDDAIEFTKTKWKDEAESRTVEITVNRDYGDVPPVSGSPAELRELFTNLINNAVDAMSDGGEICLKTFVESGNVIITLKDNGMGVPEDLRDRIFDPFFTTKGLKSTGLGLSVSYGIISRHRGSVKINSIVEEGTTFTISFPALDGSVPEAEPPAVPDWSAPRLAKILVVDDEASVCETLQDILVFEGHSVETAPDGFQAIDRLTNAKFDIVFTDMGMPGMTGRELAGEIRKIDRAVPIVLITGWDMTAEATELKQNGVSAILNKPFKMHDVIKQVAELVSE